MPEPTVSNKFYDNPSFMPNLHAWGADRSQQVPDTRTLGEDPSYLMKIIDAMLGPGGYMKYKAALDAQRAAAQKTPTPAAPMPPTPTPNPIQAGIDRGYGPSTAETEYERLVGGGY